MKNIALVGCTGSIGSQTLSVVRRYPDMFKITCLVAGSSAERLGALAREFAPKTAALTSGAPAHID